MKKKTVTKSRAKSKHVRKQVESVHGTPQAKPVELPKPIVPHDWRDEAGEVLIVKCTDKDGKGYGGFQYPSKVGGIVEAPDFNPTNACGGGIHGWPWGLGLGDGKDPDYQGFWYVIGVKTDIIGNLEGGSKCKFKSGIVRYRGQWAGALSFTLQGRIALTEHNAKIDDKLNLEKSGSASATGGRGSASATGWRGSASATGWRGSASATGERGSASATGGSGSASATGGSGSASATGWRGSASATGGVNAAVVTGPNGKAKCADGGVIALAWYNPAKQRYEMKCATTGEGRDLKADVWYSLNEKGEFVEVPA